MRNSACFPGKRLSGVQGSKSSRKENHVQIQDETSPQIYVHSKNMLPLNGPAFLQPDSSFPPFCRAPSKTFTTNLFYLPLIVAYSLPLNLIISSNNLLSFTDSVSHKNTCASQIFYDEYILYSHSIVLESNVLNYT